MNANMERTKTYPTDSSGNPVYCGKGRCCALDVPNMPLDAVPSWTCSECLWRQNRGIVGRIQERRKHRAA